MSLIDLSLLYRKDAPPLFAPSFAKIVVVTIKPSLFWSWLCDCNDGLIELHLVILTLPTCDL